MGMHFFLIDKNVHVHVHVHIGFVQLPLFFSLGSNVAFFFLGNNVASFFSILFFSFDFLGLGHASLSSYL